MAVEGTTLAAEVRGLGFYAARRPLNPSLRRPDVIPFKVQSLELQDSQIFGGLAIAA
ncbi:hypothetical protein [Kocuria rhizophila]|uniref:Uncharacterized protein n=1 Tax=Kocuria rhizophila (strain ATCC 9341 / DSM 348 / NBRC 103217 / DC2201) TaxID=378753 RepID=B2GLG4_KOCRD|nr:hypothetical protein [Kocuria rhizophila]BAG29257.1 hypothetical protein KRH_09100 [Kocuria rhizophila DC2201]